MSRHELVGEIVVFVDDHIKRRQVLFLDEFQDRFQVRRRPALDFDGDFALEPRLVLADHRFHVQIAGIVEAFLDFGDATRRIDSRKIQVQDEAIVAQGGGVGAAPGMSEEFFELVFLPDAVIALQHSAKQGLAEPSGPEKHGVLNQFQLLDILRFIVYF